MEGYVLVLVEEHDDVIIVKKPICETCISQKVGVTIIRTFSVTNAEMSSIFKQENAYDTVTHKYVQSNINPRLLKVTCICRNK